MGPEFTCPYCGEKARILGTKISRDGKDRRWSCPKCRGTFSTHEGVVVRRRHWHREPGGKWVDVV